MNNKSQLWVETVIYTLLGLAIIGLLLAYATPKIEEKKDQIIVNQEINLLKRINSKVEEINSYGAGNKRVEEARVRRGRLVIDGKNNSINFSMKGNYKYSELNIVIKEGDVEIVTRGIGEKYKIDMELNYSGRFNITYNNKEKTKHFSKAPSPYKLIITNNGKIGNLTNIDFSLIG